MKPEPFRTRGLIFVNSLSYILIAYVTVFFVVNFLQGLFATFYDIPAILFRDGLQFRADSQDWWYDSVIVVFTSKLVVFLLLALIFYAIYHKSILYKGYLKLYFLWGSFLAFTFLLGEVLYGTLLGQGFHHALSWLYIQDTGKLAFIVIILIFYVAIAMVFSKAFIVSGNIYLASYNEGALKTIFLYHMFFPYLVAMGVITLLKLPEFPVVELLSLYTGVLVFGILLFNMGKHARLFRQDEEPKPLFLDHKALLVAVFLLAGFVVIFENGLHLG